MYITRSDKEDQNRFKSNLKLHPNSAYSALTEATAALIWNGFFFIKIAANLYQRLNPVFFSFSLFSALNLMKYWKKCRNDRVLIHIIVYTVSCFFFKNVSQKNDISSEIQFEMVSKLLLSKIIPDIVHMFIILRNPNVVLQRLDVVDNKVLELNNDKRDSALIKTFWEVSGSGCSFLTTTLDTERASYHRL